MYEQTPTSTRSSNPSTLPGGVQARGLSKRFGDLWALRDLDLDVPPGSILGLLGHNGAGKTTAIRLLTTLSLPTSGTASVAGFDVVTAANQVRSRIGVTGQSATVDGLLTGRANLEMIGRLHHLPAATARKQGEEMLERLGIADAGDRLAKTYSGGMRRRLDLAASLIGDPPVLFLDEPTTGLDPAARRDLWQLIAELVRGGTTLVLTTQYLEEADELADDVIVLDHGRVIAQGSPATLKSKVGGERLDVIVTSPDELESAKRALAPFADGPADADGEALRLTVPVAPSTSLMDVVRALDASGVEATDVHRREATLDDVFLSLTERKPAEPAEASA
jgi:ABC-2 type transport system ATP-binding protein